MKPTICSFILTTILTASQVMAASVAPSGISVLNGSDCTQANIELSGLASDLVQEDYRVTSSGGEFDFSSAVIPAPSTTLNGTTTRTVTFPIAANSGSVIGVAYRIGGADLSSAEVGSFFAVYSCSSGKQIFKCAGGLGACPTTLAEYFPKPLIQSGVEGNEDELAFGTRYSPQQIADSNPYLVIDNEGWLDLQITEARLEGRDASSFELAEYSLPITIQKNGSESIAVYAIEPYTPGKKEAIVYLKTNSPSIPEFSIPVTLTIEKRPDLVVAMAVRQSPVLFGKNKAITGRVRITNQGFGATKPGAKLRVIERGNEDGNASAPRLVLRTRVPKIRAGKSFWARFYSPGHIFSKGEIHKIYSARLIGAPSQISEPYYYGVEYFNYYAPVR